MYPQFFGFTKLPFRLRPDPEFLFSGPAYAQAHGNLLNGLRSTSRLILLLGPPGAGKTLLLDDVLGEVASQFAPCRVNQPHISATELIQALLFQLGSPTSDGDANSPRLFKELSVALEARDARNAVPLLVIDDAHLLAGATLQVIGDILTRVPRLKILLVGRDEPAARGESLATRIAAIGKPRLVALPLLTAEGTRGYIDHRLDIVGAGGKELFTADAYAMIFQHSGGSARLVNVLCDAALHAACLRAAGHVSAGEILVATQDARWPEALARDKAAHLPPPPAARTAEPVDGQYDDEPAETSVEIANAMLPEPPPPAQPTKLATAQLVVTHRKEHLVTWPLVTGRISIGRANDNELRLDAPYISRHHCQVLTVGTTSTIEDLGSVNGISVNGKLAKRHVLQHADQVVLGQHVITYVVS